MADVSSPLSSATESLDLDSPTRDPHGDTSSFEPTPEPRSDNTDPDFAPATLEEADDAWQPSGSQKPASVVSVADAEDEPPVKKRRVAAKKKKGGAKDLYPEGLPRMTRLGNNTYGINTGPLCDGIDWDEMAVPVIKEQLIMRGIKHDGARAALVDRLKNWQDFNEEDGRQFLQLTHQAAFEYDPIEAGILGASAGGKRQNQGVNDKTVTAANKIKNELMYLMRRDDVRWGDDFDGGKGTIDSATFVILSNSGSTYNVGVGKSHSCDCIAKKYNPSGHCKHILYVLIYILRAPTPIIEQQKLSSEVVNMVLQHGYEFRPTQDQIAADPTMKDGIPKDKDGSDCPFCFKPLDETPAVCCNSCGRHTHNDCFALWASRSLWGVKCLVCQAPWRQEIPEMKEPASPRKDRAPKRMVEYEEDAGW